MSDLKLLFGTTEFPGNVDTVRAVFFYFLKFLSVGSRSARILPPVRMENNARTHIKGQYSFESRIIVSRTSSTWTEKFFLIRTARVSTPTRERLKNLTWRRRFRPDRRGRRQLVAKSGRLGACATGKRHLRLAR